MTAGPFATEREARNAAIALAGPPDNWSILSVDQRRQMLAGACATAGVQTGDYDERILTWLAGFEDATCAVIAGLILRAAETEGEGGEDA